MGTESHHERETGEAMADQMFVKRGCCFWMPCFGSDRSNACGGVPLWWETIRGRDNDDLCWRNHNNNNNNNADNGDKWWRKGWSALLKIREWSEIVAGPRWKTFIRRFNKNNNSKGCGGVGGAGLNKGKFQYDPLSYALNFDEGPGQSDHPDDDRLFRDFSFRFASIPISAKSSMDLGKDAPSFT